MRFAVLVSGAGSNLQALLAAEAAGSLAPGEVAVVVSNRPEAPALDRAREAGKPAVAIDHRGYPSRAAFDAAVLAELAAHEVDAVILAGFMRVLGRGFIAAFPDRIINTHPSLLPAFPGLHAAAQAIEHGVKVSGCTVHLVDAGVDTGPIIAQAAVPVEDRDDPASLHDRIRVEEHRLLPEVARLLAAGRLVRAGRRVTRAAEENPRHAD